MRVIPPLTIRNAILTSSTCAEPHATEAEYSSGTTYALGAKVILSSPTATVTVSIASPGVVTWTANGQANGTPVVLTTTGALPTGITAGAIYYIVNRATNTFELATTVGGAAILTSGSQSGTHTATTQVHRTYESLQAANLGNYPTLAASSAWWADVGPSRRWAMFDVLRNTATVHASPLTVVLTPGVRINSVALLGLVADSVTISMTSGGPSVYSYTLSLSTREVFDWYDYYFEPFSARAAVVRFDLPPYSNGIITVAITRASGDVECGACVLGNYVAIGDVDHGAEGDVLNFSSVTRDAFGGAVMVQRRNVPKTNQTLYVEKGRVNKIRALREDLNSVPAVWSGLDDTTDGYAEALLILGFYRKFSINAAHPTIATISLELEEV